MWYSNLGGGERVEHPTSARLADFDSSVKPTKLFTSTVGAKTNGGGSYVRLVHHGVRWGVRWGGWWDMYAVVDPFDRSDTPKVGSNCDQHPSDQIKVVLLPYMQ